MKKCSKCGGDFPCPEHTITINDVPDSIFLPEDADETAVKLAKELKRMFKGDLF